MHQTYNLNLEAVLSVLMRRQLSGTLSANVPKGKGVREPFRIEMAIDHGRIQSCDIKGAQKYLRGDEALKTIAQLGVLPWLFEPAATNVKAGVMTSRFGIGRPNQTNGKKQTLRTSAMKTPTKPRRNPGDPNADIVNAG
ncbi:hypothetical protein [Dictyobacter kobayashii]|nr:hypothetical protein [Dictyobacter kobayashii]